MNRDEKETVEHAIGILTRDYMKDVAELVEDLKAAIKRGDVSNSDEADRWLHESIDGCGRVIYTHQARCGLLVSDNADAWEVESFEGTPTVSRRMHLALCQDVLTHHDCPDLGDLDADYEED